MKKRKYKIDYGQKRNCIMENYAIKTDLIYGDLSIIKNPFISYVIPVYKRADLLRETLESVLNQKDVEFSWDIVVVDNEAGGENDTERLIRQINHSRILYYRNQKNIGVDGNYNRCIQTARGKWIAMLHGDDLIMNDHLYKMGKFILSGEYKNRRHPLVYICQRYHEFSDISEIETDRTKACSLNNRNSWIMSQIYHHNKLELLTQNYGLITGFYAALPSFGTIMNRRIMLKEGGFNKRLGICEDVITPYKLAGKYGVYMAPECMGYYRFNHNESMKRETILKIYASMTDFREYMYSKNMLTRIWGNIARDILNKNLRNYCIGLSRFGEKRLTSSDFDSIYCPVETRGIRLLIFRIIVGIFNKVHNLAGYNQGIENLLELNKNKIEKEFRKDSRFVLYGAGHVAEVLIPLLKRKFNGIKIECCAVSSQDDAKGKVKGIPIYYIEKLDFKKEKKTVITATEIWEYQEEMNEVLRSKDVGAVINLLD